MLLLKTRIKMDTKMRTKFIVFLTVILTLNSSCFKQQKQTPSQDKPLNIVVLLDLSDRLLNDNQISRDVEVVKMIWNYFNRIIELRMYLFSEDRFSIVSAPQSKPFTTKELNVFMDIIPSEKKSDTLSHLNEVVENFLLDVYKKDNFPLNKIEFVGADIWSFMNNSYKDYYSDNYINYIFVITDGYLDFEPSYPRPENKSHQYFSMQFLNKLRVDNFKEKIKSLGYGIMSTNSKYNDVRVMMLEVKPKNNPTFLNEEELIMTIWKNWFSDMGCSRFEFTQYHNSILQDKSKLEVKINKFLTLE